MKVPGSKIIPCQGVLGSNHSLTFGLFTQVSGSGPLGPLVFLKNIWAIWKESPNESLRENRNENLYN